MSKKPVAVSLGDPAGVGPELLLKAFAARRRLSLPPMIAFGSRLGLEAPAAHSCMADTAVQTVEHPACVSENATNTLFLIDTGDREPVVPGRASEAGAQSAIRAIESATQAVLNGDCRALTTLPVNKANLVSAGFQHPGHTEFLAELCAHDGEDPPFPVMMLCNGDFRAVPVTIHRPLAEVPGAVTTELIVKTVEIVALALERDFGISPPRISVSGLNPHAGEGGVLGHEDDAVIAPAVATLRDSGHVVTGPLPADTMFHPRARAQYDAAICMYHDQALIPVKTIAFDEAINVTLGLPIIRTSPDHGTALDIAGKGIARIDSFVAALKHADLMADRRDG